MAGDKFLTWNGSNFQEKAATQSSAGEGDAGKIIALGVDGKIHATMMPDGIGAETLSVTASEILAENDVVNLFDDAGTLKARKASAADGTKPAHGYVKAGVAADSSAVVYTDGFLPGTGLTKGTKYYLSADTPGGVAATAPTGTGKAVQAVGVAVGATQIKFEPDNNLLILA